MAELRELGRRANLNLFRDLKKYSRSDVEVIRAGARILENADSWKTWIEESLRELLELPNGSSLSLVQSSELHDEEPKTYTFEKATITIGRAVENDISLPLRSISRRHAQIVQSDDGFTIEDLASSSGTYVNRQKLEPGRPRQLRNGDKFLIFPYAFEATQRELWARDNEIAVTYSARFGASPESVLVANAGSDICLFQLRLHPDIGHVTLGLARPLVKTILSRLTRDKALELVEGDAGLMEFVVMSLLERANRELQFQLQFSLVPRGQFVLEDKPGLTLEASLRLTEMQGRLLLFFNDACLRRIQRGKPIGLPTDFRQQLRWKMTVRLGFVSLQVRDLEDLEQGDTLLHTEQVELVLLNRLKERVWVAEQSKEEARRFTVKEFFERSVAMEESNDQIQETVETDQLDAASLTVRLQVVLSEVEMSLHELEGLRAGSVVELGELPDQVQLVINGKVLGTGEIVDVEERLGVQITRWRKL